VLLYALVRSSAATGQVMVTRRQEGGAAFERPVEASFREGRVASGVVVCSCCQSATPPGDVVSSPVPFQAVLVAGSTRQPFVSTVQVVARGWGWNGGR